MKKIVIIAIVVVVIAGSVGAAIWMKKKKEATSGGTETDYQSGLGAGTSVDQPVSPIEIQIYNMAQHYGLQSRWKKYFETYKAQFAAQNNPNNALAGTECEIRGDFAGGNKETLAAKPAFLSFTVPAYCK